MGGRLPAAAALVAAGAFLVLGDTRADDAGADAARRAKRVATVGTGPVSRTLSIADVEDRVASMPAFQRATFGGTADAIRHRVLEEVLVRDALFAIGAQATKVEAQPAVALAVDRAASSATVRAVRDELGSGATIPMDDVRAYFERNRARYDAPPRYQLWRILCKTRSEAQSVLAAAQADPTPKAFAQLAREHSEDKATALRSGNLGFLTADGASSEPGLRVDPSIVRAAQAVGDGELVRVPVAEGDFFSVVWRRGTSAPPKRTLDEVAVSIREILSSERVKEGTDKLVATLRAAKLRDLHEDLLDALDLPDPAAARGD